MQATIAVLLLIVPIGCALAEVYRSIGADGRVQYTDRPVLGAEPVPVIQDQASAQGERTVTTTAGQQLGPYTAFEIVSPEVNATVRDETGRLPISLMLDPPLLPGHRLRLLLDGQPVSAEVPGTQFNLDGLGYGSHRLQAQVVDEQDVPIASTEIVDFHLRKPAPNADIP